MKIVAGLGNPGRKYAKSRHNLGFLAIDKIIESIGIKSEEEFNNSILYKGNVSGLLLLKPMNYMNRSGGPIRELMSYYKVDIADLLVIYDDLDLPLGAVRYRDKGGHGGHNGIRSIVESLSTHEFKRIRVGIGRPAEVMNMTDYVLGKFEDDEKKIILASLDEVLTIAKEKVISVAN
ncbi:MAG: aminoacyl-tRNA hydrolase [Nitrospinota bacterium]